MNDDASTLECLIADPLSECLNCGKPGEVHIDKKCPFEASNFEASSRYVHFKAAPLPNISGATFGDVWGFTKVYK